MPFESKTRYGAQERFDSEADVSSVVERLLNELETEQHEAPDREHTQIAISNGDWSLTVYVSGLMELGALGWITGSPDDVPAPSLYLRADSRDVAVRLLTLMAEGRVDELKAAPWSRFEELSPHQRDIFRADPNG